MTSPTPPATPSPDSAVPAARIHWGLWVALVVLAVGFISVGVDAALHFTDTPIDGPFQLFNALRRLANGQRFGGSFQFFHGPGIPYLHLIPFWILGSTFLASELSRELVSTVAAILIVVAFCRAWAGSWRAGIPMTVVALVMLIPLRVNALIFPINSMLGLRSTLPLLVGVHLLLRGTSWRASLERAALIAITIACGIEQGSATIAALMIVAIVQSVRRRESATLLRLAASALGGVLVFVLIVVVMSPSGFRSVLEFNFRTVPGDQFWYFGGPPNRFLYRWSQLSIFLTRPIWSLLVFGTVGWCLVRFWKGADGDSSRLAAEAFLSVYALVSTASMLGTFNTVYFQPAVRVAMLLGLFAVRREWLARKDRLAISEGLRRRMPTYAVFGTIGFAIAGYSQASIAIVRTPLHLVYAHLILGDKPTMTAEWDATTDLGLLTVERERERLGRTPKIWSTYASYVEWKVGAFHPYFDYIIHALGHENREGYAAHFLAEKPDIVQTVSPTYTMYEEWLEVNHWNFYRPLLRDYSIVGVGPWSYFWVRRSVAWDEHPERVVESAIPPGNIALKFPALGVPDNEVGLFEVMLGYHVVNPLKPVPVVGSLPRFLVYIGGKTANHNPISLAPYETRRVFPVLAVGPGDIYVRGAVVSLLGTGGIVFDSIRVDRIRIAPENLQWARDFILGPKADSSSGSKR